jgi:hypothetical protein
MKWIHVFLHILRRVWDIGVSQKIAFVVGLRARLIQGDGHGCLATTLQKYARIGPRHHLCLRMRCHIAWLMIILKTWDARGSIKCVPAKSRTGCISTYVSLTALSIYMMRFSALTGSADMQSRCHYQPNASYVVQRDKLALWFSYVVCPIPRL